MVVVETATSSLPSVEDVTEMDKLMSDGKRNYICNQPHLALDCFVDLCEKLAKWYGQESDKCVEAYLFYGKTLLDVARLENGVLGHAIKEMPVFGSGTETEDQDTEKECNTEDEEDAASLKPAEIRTCVISAMREDNLYNESTEEEEQTEDEEGGEEKAEGAGGDEGANKKGDDVAASEKETTDVTSTTTTAEENTGMDESTTTAVTSSVAPATTTTEDKIDDKGDRGMDVDAGIDCEGSDDDGTDDVSNLELAWEMFELTSLILRRQLQEAGCDPKAIKSQLAESKYGLAQISLEAGRYEDSVNDFTECLDVYKEILDDKNGRVIAEGHYNIALALSFDKKYEQAIKAYEMAVTILKARVQDLESKVNVMDEKKDKTDADFTELREWNEEIAELNDLIVLDMMAKIEDAQEAKKLLDETITTVKDVASGTKSEFDAGFSEGFDASLKQVGEVVHDCSSKIRSTKRKSDDEMSDVSDKKVKQTDNVVSKPK